MPYPGWSEHQIAQYKAVLADVVNRHPKMSHDEAQAHAARIVNSQVNQPEHLARKIFSKDS